MQRRGPRARAAPTRRGDLDAINLAAKVADGQQVVVPRRGRRRARGRGASAAAARGAAPAAARRRGQPQQRHAEQLDTLDGVGPATAQKILDYRAQHGGFARSTTSAQVPGIGPKRLAALRDVQP